MLVALGSQTAVVSHASLVAMEQICVSLGVASISDLLCQNADYLINTITLNLRCGHIPGLYTAAAPPPPCPIVVSSWAFCVCVPHPFLLPFSSRHVLRLQLAARRLSASLQRCIEASS